MTFEEAFEIFSSPFFKLLSRAHEVHAENFDEQTVQISDILSVRTGGCSEDCAYCVQSAKNGTKAPKQPMLSPEVVVEAAKKAKERGASRFCMSTSGRCLAQKIEFDRVCEMVKAVHELGMETETFTLTINMINSERVETKRGKDGTKMLEMRV